MIKRTDLSGKIFLTNTLLSQEIDEETILLDMKSENYFGFDSVGSDIWRLLKEGKSLQETYDSLIGMYDAEPGVLEKDLLEFVEKLDDYGLVKIG